MKAANPSIERTVQRPLRAPWPVAHVEHTRPLRNDLQNRSGSFLPFQPQLTGLASQKLFRRLVSDAAGFLHRLGCFTHG